MKNKEEKSIKWDIPGKNGLIHFYHKVDSTMTIARAMAEKDCPGGAIIIAEEQDSGKGRLKRSWISEKGGLYFTYIIRTSLDFSFTWRFNFAAALSLVNTLKNYYEINAFIKWPNDVLVKTNKSDSITEGGNDKYSGFSGYEKICGILSDMQLDSQLNIKYINIGMGININNNPARLVPGACSLKSLLGKEVPVKSFLVKFLIEWEGCLKDITNPKILIEWKKKSITLGRNVKVVLIKETLYGKALDLNEEGALVLELEDGRKVVVNHGDCFNC